MHIHNDNIDSVSMINVSYMTLMHVETQDLSSKKEMLPVRWGKKEMLSARWGKKEMLPVRWGKKENFAGSLG